MQASTASSITQAAFSSGCIIITRKDIFIAIHLWVVPQSFDKLTARPVLLCSSFILSYRRPSGVGCLWGFIP